MSDATRFDAAEPSHDYLAAVAAEEKTAATRALSDFLRPRRIAVVGASRRPGTIGNLVFRNLIDGEFTGVVYPVNPHADAIRSVAAHATLADCPRTPDLAIVAVPAALVTGVIDEAAALGIEAVCVISAGFAESDEHGIALQRELMEHARGQGVRIIGPNCMGLLAGSDQIRMNATFSRVFPRPGRTSFLSQSGALGLSVLEQFESLGLGIASFVSVGNKADISGNDLLLHWEDDPDTDVILFYLESFGNPRRFSRLARRVSRSKPIVVVKAGRSAAGKRAAASHTAALAAGDVAVDALFAQTGVIRTDTLEEMLAVASLLATQPAPPGKRTAILTNGGGPGILAADACEAHGLTLPALSDQLRASLAGILPASAGTSNPVDMIASATAEQYEAAMRLLTTSGEVDAVMVVFIPPMVTSANDVAEAIIRADVHTPPDVTVTTVFMNDEVIRAQLTTAGLPTFGFPEDAARALAHAADWAAWRDAPHGSVIRPAGMQTDEARHIIADALEDGTAAVTDAHVTAKPETVGGHEDSGVWLGAEQAHALLGAYGVPLAASRVVTSAEDAAAAQHEIGRPVAVKLAAAIHKRDVGGVVVDIETPEDAAAAVRRIEADVTAAGLGQRTGSYLVQEMIPDGVELLVGVTHDPAFGPLVMVGLGGTLVELLGDVSVRITPLTDVDVEAMLTSLRSAPLLTGYRGSPAVDRDALRDLLYRISALVEDHAEIVELDLNPVFASARGVSAVDARIRVATMPSRPPVRSTG